MGAYVEYHVCGDLTLSGSGSLLSNSTPAVVVIENGSLTLASKANVAANAVTFVLTGTNSSKIYHQIVFPNGKGQLATLTVEPPSAAADPWHGIAIYEDPSLTQNVDMDVGPGGSLDFDGVAYMPYSNVTFHGNMASGTNNCSKLIVDSMTINGSGTLTLAQSTSACAAITMNQPAAAYLSK